MASGLPLPVNDVCHRQIVRNSLRTKERLEQDRTVDIRNGNNPLFRFAGGLPRESHERLPDGEECPASQILFVSSQQLAITDR